MGKVTIKDLASLLGVHHSTVSRALRDHPDVSKDTKKRVIKLAKKINYSPNIFARNLKTNSNLAIGVIVPEIKHYFFSSVISGIDEIAHKEGYALLLSQSNENYMREKTNTNALVSNRVAGLLVSISQTTKNYSHFRSLQENGIHLVFFDRVVESIKTSKVVVDDYEGAYKATEYMIKKGYKRIGHLAGAKNILITKNRFQGYRDCLIKNGIDFNESLVFFGGFQEEDGIKGMKYLLGLKKGPDAILAVNDPVAFGAYEIIRSKGLKIPNDIAVIGFSNNPNSALIEPSLTTVEQPAFEIGKQAAEILFQQIKTKSFKPITKILKTNLIERNSA